MFAVVVELGDIISVVVMGVIALPEVSTVESLWVEDWPWAELLLGDVDEESLLVDRDGGGAANTGGEMVG